MKPLSILIGFLIICGAVTWGYFQYQKPHWKASIKELMVEAQSTPLKSESWGILSEKAQTALPRFYPFSLVGETFYDVANVLQKYEEKPEININTEKNLIPTESIEGAHVYLDNLQASVEQLFRTTQKLPENYIPESYRETFRKEKEKLQKVVSLSRDIDTIQKAIDEAFKEKSSIMLLLQNQHEPRSTGGFSGSLVHFDFTDEGLAWDFSDVYAIDRDIPEIVQIPAPEFFHDLSKNISFRDSNFWPDFPTSAQVYQSLLEGAGKKSPDTIIAINLNIIRDILAMTGSINLEPWYIEANTENFDIVLQFLVESKIAGRFSTKAPIDYFATRLIKEVMALKDSEAFEAKLKKWVTNKDLMIYSRNASLQKLIRQAKIGGPLEPSEQVDDFLHFDFVSIGANKSEKFVWTNFEHNSEIDPQGFIRNTIKIKRTHALRNGQIESILGLEKLPPNIQALFAGDIPWKLGYGQNRTILRLWVPLEAKLLSNATVSGPIKTAQDEKMPGFQIWEVPLFISPRESMQTEISYLTKLKKGNAKWRPYFFQLLGTPGRDEKTKFLKTISTPTPANIEYLDQNTGGWQPLHDTDYRADVRF